MAEPRPCFNGSNRRSQQHDATVDLGPRRIAQILGPPGDDPGRAPEIMQGLLWEWIKTTSPPKGEAPVEPYFSGIAAPDISVSLIWRSTFRERRTAVATRDGQRDGRGAATGSARSTPGG